MFILGSTIEYNKSQILYQLNITSIYADYTIIDSDGNDVTDAKKLPAGQYTFNTNNANLGFTVNGEHITESSSTITIDNPVTIMVDELTPTSSIVYTLSDDGEYYIVGTGFKNLYEVTHNYTGATYGTGLDATWQGGDLVIPNTYNNKPVKAIAPAAFGDITNMTSFNIANGVTIIGDRAFQIPTTSANFPDTTLTDYRFPADLEFLGWWNDTIYNNTDTLSASNASLDFPKQQILGSGAGSGRVMWGRAGISEIKIPKNYNIIPLSTFAYCTGLGSTLNIPNHIQAIHSNAFQYCLNFQIINIPSSVKYCASEVFYACDNVVDFVIDANSQGRWIYPWIRKQDNTYVHIEQYTYYHEEEDGYYLGSKDNPYFLLLEAIGSGTTYSVRDGVQIIDSGAISISTLTSVTIPDSVLGVGNSIISSTQVSTLTLPNNLKAIVGSARMVPSAITVSNIPESLEYITDNAFQGITLGQTDINLPNIQALGYNTFQQTNIISVNITSKKITVIPNGCFYSCSQLVTVSLSDSIEGIGNTAFSNCTALQTINLENVNNAIGTQTFYTCTALKNVTLSNKLRIIGSSAFYGCNNSGFNAITIPASVKKISSQAFYNCTNLSSAIFEDTANWWYASGYAATSGTSITVTNAATAASYLRNTNYGNYWWNKGVYTS